MIYSVTNVFYRKIPQLWLFGTNMESKLRKYWLTMANWLSTLSISAVTYVHQDTLHKSVIIHSRQESDIKILQKSPKKSDTIEHTQNATKLCSHGYIFPADTYSSPEVVSFEVHPPMTSTLTATMTTPQRERQSTERERGIDRAREPPCVHFRSELPPVSLFLSFSYSYTSSNYSSECTQHSAPGKDTVSTLEGDGPCRGEQDGRKNESATGKRTPGMCVSVSTLRTLPVVLGRTPGTVTPGAERFEVVWWKIFPTFPLFQSTGRCFARLP